jgi:hypothetical protein
MYCGQCGHSVAQQANYCGSCGARRPLRPTASAPAAGMPPCCAACGRILRGSYVVFDGASFHARCYARYRATLAACVWCGNWTPPSGHLEQEGLTVCRACHATAINTPAQATPIMRDVVAWLHQQGVWWSPQPLPLRLVERHRLQSAQHPQRFGLTTTRVAWQPGRGEQRVVEQVLVLRSLPSVPFTACLTHELGHVWLHLRGLDGLTVLC